MRLLVVLAFLSLALAGCVTPGADVGKLNAPRTAIEALPHLELSDAHDHKDRAAHDIKWNVELLGHDPIAPSVEELGRYNQVVVVGDTAYVSTYHLANGSAPGLAVLDLSSGKPVMVGKLETPDLTPIDVFPSPDGKRVFLAGHADNRLPLPNACTGLPQANVCVPFVPAGVYMVDVQDPASPKVVDKYVSFPSGAHTVKAHDVGGKTFVFIASYGFSTASRLASSVEIARVDGDRMVPVGHFLAKRASGTDGAARTFVHDMWVEEHPDGRTLLYVAYWDGGVVIADVGDPSNPKEVADWRDFDAETFGNVHFVRPVGVIGERHVTLATPEFGQAEHSGEAYVLDTTDPSKPELLSKWTLPGNPVNDGGYRFSPHNFDPLPNSTLVAYAHYHGGVWVLDLAQPESPAVKAYVFPTVPAEEGEPNTAEDAPNVWNAVWMRDGTLVASDIGTGLFHYRMLSDAPGTPPYEAFLG